ncbi:MAG TPA: ABC transporter permease subunit [Candidatus Saccharimonadales bacterium]|nr:ABC transporter permease subunit [Candidatus Saccharimonadales bacterium]
MTAAPLPRYRATRWRRFAVSIVPILVAVGIWWVLTLLLDRPRVYPTPPVVAEALAQIASGEGEVGSTYVHIAATLFRLAVAFLVSLVVGTAIGILAGRVRIVFSLIENVLWVFLAVPSIVWVFLFAVAFGISNVVPIAAMTALLTPMVIVNVAEGAKSVPSDLVEMARSYKVGRLQRTVELFLPYLVPYITSSARTAFALGIKLVVVTEVVGLATGIGYEVKYWYTRLFMGPIVAWGIVMIVIGLVVDRLVFGPIERRVSRWKGPERGVQIAGRIE